MANKHQMNGDMEFEVVTFDTHEREMEADIEIKLEPASNDFGDDDNDTENGFAGFDNTNTIPSTTDVGALNLWTSHATACLIAQYKKFHSMVGQTTRIRSFREMFETISLEMQKSGFYFSPQKCENKWRVLERKYKNLVYRERLKKPGRIRHYGHWEHKRALDEIFNEKKRHMYMDESDFPPPSGSAKLVQKVIRDTGVPSRTSPPREECLGLGSCVPQRKEGPKVTLAFFETFLMEMNKNFAQAEANRERRHKEQMSIRESELEVQKKLLKLKEQKMELRMNQMTAAAQYFHLNMD